MKQFDHSLFTSRVGLFLLAVAVLLMPRPTLAQPTELDEAYLDAGLLQVGAFTVCKVAPGSAEEFPFEVEVNGTLSDYTLFDSTAPPPELVDPLECVDVHVDTDSREDQVTIRELPPAGWEVSRVAVWNVDRIDGDEVVTFHEEPAGTEEISGGIDNNKLGCLALFYNDMDQGACWMTGGRQVRADHGRRYGDLLGRQQGTGRYRWRSGLPRLQLRAEQRRAVEPRCA